MPIQRDGRISGVKMYMHIYECKGPHDNDCYNRMVITMATPEQTYTEINVIR